jgi:hypothetical protein
MSASGIILRETAISVVINAVLSLAFFLVVFGMKEPVTLGALAPDFLPQSFMVVLMGALVPSMLLRRSIGGPAGPIIRRSLALAFAAAVLGGGGGFALCQIEPSKVLPALWALPIKTSYGAILAAIFTPIAIGALLKERSIPQ